MKKCITAIFGLFFFVSTFGQDIDKYFRLIEEARNLYENKDYFNSGVKYSEAFICVREKAQLDDRYNAACSWALAGELDSSFVELLFISDKSNFKNLEQIITDDDLKDLHHDARWEKLINRIKSNKEISEKLHDKNLIAVLDTIYYDDQHYREQLNVIEKKYGWDSQEIKEQWDTISFKDSINTIKVTKMIDTYGWLGEDIVGERGNKTIFLTIQHADIFTQVKYLPDLREAVKDGKAIPKQLAYLEDRVALGIGEKQKYGSQLTENPTGTQKYCVRPMIDPENVNKRRFEVGLGSIEEYVSRFDCTWDVNEYLRILPEIEKREAMFLKPYLTKQ